jgi:hypothetical protein
MAAKILMMKLLQELQGFAEITHRRPQSRSPGLFMMQLRSHTSHTTLPNARRNIVIHVPEALTAPAEVKITHLRQTREPTARLAAP